MQSRKPSGIAMLTTEPARSGIERWNKIRALPKALLIAFILVAHSLCMSKDIGAQQPRTMDNQPGSTDCHTKDSEGAKIT